MTIALAAKAMGCSPDAASCGDMAVWLEQALLPAWGILFDLRIYGAFIAVIALSLPFAFNSRPAVVGAIGFAAAGAPVAAFILPHVAVLTSLPTACRLNEGSNGSCALWGHDMDLAFNSAGAAFWLIMLILPMILAGVVISAVIATFRHRRTA